MSLYILWITQSHLKLLDNIQLTLLHIEKNCYKKCLISFLGTLQN